MNSIVSSDSGGSMLRCASVWGSYHLDTPVLAFERNWHGPRLQLTLSYSWVGERQGAGCLDINDYL